MVYFYKLIDSKTKQIDDITTDEQQATIIGSSNQTEIEPVNYNGLWYLAGYAPEKPAKETAQEKIAELKDELAKSDYIDNKFIEAVVKNDSELLEALKVKYKDKLEERQAIRNRIDELEEIING